MGVEVADGQRLHVREHAVTDVLEGALGDRNHDAVIEIGCDQTGRVQAGHAGQSVQQVGKDRRVHEQKGLAVVVNERLEEDRSADRGGWWLISCRRNRLDSARMVYPIKCSDSMFGNTLLSRNLLACLHFVSLHKFKPKMKKSPDKSQSFFGYTTAGEAVGASVNCRHILPRRAKSSTQRTISSVIMAIQAPHTPSGPASR